MTRTTADELASSLERVYRRLGLYRDEAVQQSPKEVAFLQFVEDHGPCRVKDLAEGLRLPLSTVSWTVDRMVDRGYFKRKPDPRDRRAVRVELAAGGRRAVARQHEIFVRVAELAAAQMPENQFATILDVVKQFAETM